MADFTDEDFKRVIERTLRLLAILTAVALPLVWWKMSWQSAALLVVGAAVSGSGVWEYPRLMSGMLQAMEGGGTAKPGRLLAGFFLRLCVVGAVLYVTLKYLDGSVLAVAGGLCLGLIALGYEGFRAMHGLTN